MKQLHRLLVSLVVPAFMLAGVAANPAFAQDKAKDAKAAPAAKAEKGKPTIKVLLESDKVRVTEVTFKPGDENDSITRPHRILRVLNGGTIQQTYPDGKIVKHERKIGQVWEAGPDASPSKLKNIGKTDVVYYQVTIKEMKK